MEVAAPGTMRTETLMRAATLAFCLLLPCAAAAGDREPAPLEAVDAARAALDARPRARDPIEWATAQTALGDALLTLGARESDTANLAAAAAAYRAALEVLTRDRFPAQWGRLQYNLGNALETQGERESGTARLEEAVAAYRAALEERTRDRAPLQWAGAAGNQGIALMLIAERTRDGARALQAFDLITGAAAAAGEAGDRPTADAYASLLPKARDLARVLNER
jgi:tetratricopeptide (TPR) repeat protein